jgi:hypothetical protein
MFVRFVFVVAAFLVFSAGVIAEEHRNKAHQFEANFPSTVQPLSVPINGGGHIELVRSQDGSQVFVLGVADFAGKSLKLQDLKEYAVDFVGGAIGKLKNGEISKQGEFKVNNRSRVGYGMLVKHDAGVQFHWVTIENGKLYFVTLQADSKEELDTPKVKSFLESIRIIDCKDAKGSK